MQLRAANGFRKRSNRLPKTFVLAASLLGVALLREPVLAEDCANCLSDVAGGKLCESHAAAEAAALPALRRKIKSGADREVRVEALRAAAALTHPHQNAPSKDVMDALVLGFADEDVEVRVAAARLAGSSQHPDLGRKRLLGAAAEATTLIGKASTKIDKYENIDLFPPLFADNETFVAWLRQARKFCKKIETLQKTVEDESTFLVAAAEAAANYSSPKSVALTREALVTITKYYAEKSPALTRLALQQGEREDLRLTILAAKSYKSYIDMRKHANLLEEDSVIARSLRAKYESKFGEEIYEQLEEFAEEHDIEAPPAWDEKAFGDNLDPWFEEHFPPKR